jgi:hypothetical protein
VAPWRRAAVLGLLTAALARGADPDALARLEAENAALRERVQALAQALARARAELDRLSVEDERRAYEQAGGTPPDLGPRGAPAGVAAGFGVVDVNRRLGMLVVGGGWRHGVRPGMRFAVLKGDRCVAHARVVDVRAQIAGAVLEGGNGRTAPEPGDRVILAGESAE